MQVCVEEDQVHVALQIQQTLQSQSLDLRLIFRALDLSNETNNTHMNMIPAAGLYRTKLRNGAGISGALKYICQVFAFYHGILILGNVYLCTTTSLSIVQ